MGWWRRRSGVERGHGAEAEREAEADNSAEDRFVAWRQRIAGFGFR